MITSWKHGMEALLSYEGESIFFRTLDTDILASDYSLLSLAH